MHVNRILELADFIEKSDTYVERQWSSVYEAEVSLKFHEDLKLTRLPANIVGHAIVLFKDRYFDELVNVCQEQDLKLDDLINTTKEIRIYLGLDVTESFRLFCRPPPLNAPREVAVETLRNLAKTGRVEWSDE